MSDIQAQSLLNHAAEQWAKHGYKEALPVAIIAERIAVSESMRQRCGDAVAAYHDGSLNRVRAHLLLSETIRWVAAAPEDQLRPTSSATQAFSHDCCDDEP